MPLAGIPVRRSGHQLDLGTVLIEDPQDRRLVAIVRAEAIKLVLTEIEGDFERAVKTPEADAMLRLAVGAHVVEEDQTGWPLRRRADAQPGQETHSLPFKGEPHSSGPRSSLVCAAPRPARRMIIIFSS